MTDSTKQTIDEWFDEYNPKPYPDYNMGLLPDEDGYDEVQVYRNHQWWADREEAKVALSALIDEVIGEDEDRNHRYNTNWRVEVDAQNYLRQQQRQRKRELMG